MPTSALILLFLLLSLAANAQHTMQDFLYQRCEVIFFGLDFSKVRMIGSEGFTEPQRIQEYYLNKWNFLMLLESDKYNWSKALKTPRLKSDFWPVAHGHALVDPARMVIDSAYSLHQQDVTAAITALATTAYPKGIGVVVVMEALDKQAVMATGYIIFFDLGTKAILYQQRLSGVPIGFGFRNYWAASFHDMMEVTQRDVMREVKAKYK